MSTDNMCQTGFLNNLSQQYDVWEHLSIPELFPGVSVRFNSKLPFGVWGLTDFEKRTVTLTTGMNAAEMRSTLAHEIVHLERGAGTFETEHVEELLCDLVAATRLVPAAQLLGLTDRVEREGREAVESSLVIDEKMLEVALELEAALVAMMNKGVGSGGDSAEWRSQEAALAAVDLHEAARA